MGMSRVKSPAERGRMGAKAFLRKVAPEDRQEIARTAAVARWRKTTKEQRREIARKAVQARWATVRAARTGKHPPKAN
jgi:hypothetical protein